MTHQRTIIEKHYDTKARIQLDFKSYMKLSIFICIGFPFMYVFYVALYSLDIYLDKDIESDVTVISFLLTFLPGMVIYFLIGLVASMIMYPVYRWWCEKHRGQLMSGKFAMIRAIEKERDGQEKSAG